MNKILCLAPCFLLMVGCSGEPEIDSYIQQVKNSPAAPIDPLPDMTLPKTVGYAANALRSPFFRSKMPGAQVALGDVHPEFDRPKEALEHFPLDALKMVGTLERREQRWAIILDASGHIYRATQGSYIGKHNGKIVNVSEDSIDVVELIPDASQGWRERKARLGFAGD